MEQLTIQALDYRIGIIKKYADHLRDIDAIIASKKASSMPDVFALEKYKEAVIDLFIEHSKLSADALHHLL